MEDSIFKSHDIIWLHELAARTGISKEYLDKLVRAGDLIAIDMSATGSKRRKIAIRRDAWYEFLKQRTTTAIVRPRRPPPRRIKPKVPDYLGRGKRPA